jgi:hypothetical protein
MESLQDRQRKTGGLPGPGLRGGEEVAASEDGWNGLSLDRGRLGIAGIGNGTQQLGRQTQGGKVSNLRQTEKLLPHPRVGSIGAHG